MDVARQVLIAIEDAEVRQSGRLDSALLHACIAIDATARRLYPDLKVGDRYTRCLREYMWLIEPMMGYGINLIETKFDNVSIKNRPRPDLSDLIYHKSRCHTAHGEEIPDEFTIMVNDDPYQSAWELGPNIVRMPHRIIWALLSVAVFSSVHNGVVSVGTHYLTYKDNVFRVSEWWGREDEVRSMLEEEPVIRVKLQNLGTMRPMD